MRRKVYLIPALLGIFGAGVSARAAVTTFLTNFTKSDNIFTNLNEQYPHTDSGTGVPGSGIGTANASFLFDPSSTAVQAAGYAPNYINGSNLVNNGIDFQLTSDSAGHDFVEINAGQALTITANVNNVQNVYLLMGAYNGQSFNATFTGADNTTQIFNSIFVPDFNGGSVNSTSGNPTVQTLFQVHDVGAGGTGNSTNGATNNYDLTEVGFALEPALANEQLSSISISSDGFDILVLGATTSSAPEPSSLALAALGAVALCVRSRKKFAQ